MFKADSSACMFSIDKMKKYEIKKTRVKDAIGCRYNNCFWFNYGLWVRNNFMSSNKNGVQLTDYGIGEPQYEINNGEESFTVKQLYVYQIAFS